MSLRKHNPAGAKPQFNSWLMTLIGVSHFLVSVSFAQVSSPSQPYPSEGGSGSTSKLRSRSSNYPDSGTGSESRTSSSNRRSRSSRQNRLSSSENSSKQRDKKGATPTPAVAGAPARASAQGVSLAGEKKKGGGGGGSIMPDSFPPPSYELSAQIQSDSLYFSPAAITTRKGERFTTPFHFLNASGHRVDRLDVWIHYDPRLFDPVWLNSSALREAGATEIKREVMRDAGYVRLEAKFPSPSTGLLLPLGEINWTALEGPAVAEISFEAPPGKPLGVFEGEQVVIEDTKILNRGLVPVEVRVYEADALIESDAEDRAITLVREGEDPERPGAMRGRGVRLALVPDSTPVALGDLSTVDVALINPDLTEFDELSVRVRFDPEAVEILDADRDNYVSLGVNVYDGAFHDAMPFDRHVANEVDSERGIIIYSVANQNRIYPYRSGTFARIYFRLKSETPGATFWFEAEDPATGRRASGVKSRGRELIQSSASLHNVRILTAIQSN